MSFSIPDIINYHKVSSLIPIYCLTVPQVRDQAQYHHSLWRVSGGQNEEVSWPGPCIWYSTEKPRSTTVEETSRIQFRSHETEAVSTLAITFPDSISCSHLTHGPCTLKPATAGHSLSSLDLTSFSTSKISLLSRNDHGITLGLSRKSSTIYLKVNQLVTVLFFFYRHYTGRR